MSVNGDTVLKDDVKSEHQTNEPPKYAVIFLNDDFTPMDFVVHLLTEIFHHPSDKAAALMLQIHQSGQAVVGTYNKDIAETKVTEVNTLAHTYDHPLKAVSRPINT